MRLPPGPFRGLPGLLDAHSYCEWRRCGPCVNLWKWATSDLQGSKDPSPKWKIMFYQGDVSLDKSGRRTRETWSYIRWVMQFYTSSSAQTIQPLILLQTALYLEFARNSFLSLACFPHKKR